MSEGLCFPLHQWLVSVWYERGTNTAHDDLKAKMYNSL